MVKLEGPTKNRKNAIILLVPSDMETAAPSGSCPFLRMLESCNPQHGPQGLVPGDS